MRVLLLSPYPQMLVPAIRVTKDEPVVFAGPPEAWPQADLAICFGYKKKISDAILAEKDGKIINVHLSMLPWNMGSDPNFWSWFEGTPKGVSVHFISPQGAPDPVIAQEEIQKWRKEETLATSYHILQQAAMRLFWHQWPRIRRGNWMPVSVTGSGSRHAVGDKFKWMKFLPMGWNTPVEEVAKLGEAFRDEQCTSA